ncbi:MAG: hypothetical protein MK116_06240 [Phycisphaerales bacterium]|nr:hypothetical protein [Phycisphaerales bacterium]
MIKQRNPIHPWYPHERLKPRPPHPRANLVVLTAMLALGVLLAAAVPMLVDYRQIGMNALGITAVSVGIPIALAWATVLVIQRRWMTRARRHDFALCLTCGEPLDGLGESGQCPSCQAPFQLDQTQWGWKRLLDLPAPPVPPGDDIEDRPVGSTQQLPPRPVRSFILVFYGLLIFMAMFFADVTGWILGLLDSADQLNTTWGYIAPWIELPLLGIVIYFTLAHRRRWRKKVQRANHLLCLHCGYSLQGLPPNGHCPECGVEYRHRYCEAVWKKFCEKTHKWPRDRKKADTLSS